MKGGTNDRMIDYNNIIGKKIKIFLKNGFVFQGKLISVDFKNLEIDDIKVGKLLLNRDSIMSIQQSDGNTKTVTK